MRTFLWRWLPPLGWMGLIFVISAQPTLPHVEQPWLDRLVKKAGHLLAYGILAWLYRRVLCRRLHSAIAARVLSWGLALTYGLTDEYHQTFVPGRDGTLMDVAVDGVGAGAAMLVDSWCKYREAEARQATDARS